jgi:hypothetical protein
MQGVISVVITKVEALHVGGGGTGLSVVVWKV